jgi:hypothetical protein
LALQFVLDFSKSRFSANSGRTSKGGCARKLLGRRGVRRRRQDGDEKMLRSFYQAFARWRPSTHISPLMRPTTLPQTALEDPTRATFRQFGFWEFDAARDFVIGQEAPAMSDQFIHKVELSAPDNTGRLGPRSV